MKRSKHCPLALAFEVLPDGSAVFQDSRSAYGTPHINPFTFEYQGGALPVASPEGRGPHPALGF
jgi:hypothetical protein